MPRNEEGEFELVLGNRQLLSGFFIVVILFGVFFTMGYIVGRHSSPTPSQAASANAPVENAAAAPAGESSGPAPGQAEVVTAEKKQEPVAGTRPATESGASATEAAAAKEVAATKTAEKTETGPPSRPGGPQAGDTFLQVSAPRRDAAEGVVAGLKKLGVTAVLAPGPNDDTVRVLVGPFKDTETMGGMREKLVGAGFKPFVRKY